VRLRLGAAAIALAAASLGSAVGCTSEPEPASGTAAVIADHHVHILGPGLVRDWKSLGVPFSKPDSAYTSAAGLGVEQALLLPMAHLYGNEEFRGALKLSLEQERAAVQRENDHVAQEAAQRGAGFVAFCGVDASRPYAWDEIRRCRTELRSAGVKLHLASAGIDPRRDEDLAKVARVAAWADSNRVTLWIHFDPQRRGVELADVQRFIDRVLAPHPGLEVGIAHLGGSGGYGDWTRSVHRTFATWLRAEGAAGRPRPGVHLDLSAVWLERESEGVPASTAEQGAALGADIAEFGAQRLVLGSDYPVFDPGRSAEALRVGAGIDSTTWARILANRMPVLDGATARQ